MKKIIYVAVMALAVVIASCSGSGSSKRYSAGGDAPKIDTEKATVNGRHYDDKTARCWKVTTSGKLSVFGISAEAKNKVVYEWSTEFALVSTMEAAMYAAAQAGDAASASYKYVATTDKDSESCLGHN